MNVMNMIVVVVVSVVMRTKDEKTIIALAKWRSELSWMDTCILIYIWYMRVCLEQQEVVNIYMYIHLYTHVCI